MKLINVELNQLNLGKLVVLLSDNPGEQKYALRFIERITYLGIFLEYATFFLDETDKTELIKYEELNDRIKVPILEEGDKIIFRGKQGKIVKCSINDLHVIIQLEDPSINEIYTSIIHLDFTPTFNTIGVQ